MSVSVRQVVSGALAGKTIGRVFFNEKVRSLSSQLSGRVLDLAGGRAPSYLPLLPSTIDLVRTDYRASEGVLAVDMNAPLPFKDGEFDAVLLFNALYAAEDALAVAKEVRRILKPSGTWYLVSPFVANEMPEPHDYMRFTAEGLERLCKNAGFSSVTVDRFGERASAAVQITHPFYYFNFVRALVYTLAIFADSLVTKRARVAHPTPLGYLVRARKGF